LKKKVGKNKKILLPNKIAKFLIKNIFMEIAITISGNFIGQVILEVIIIEIRLKSLSI
jgi:hypothetical protein